ncbi:MAG: PEP-CTERM sorting domain-containing protein [Planctomycetaceae bacterium]|nr:PEP-CTERM sorting domain-containing protein [Planctomycetaceae bacterium]
MFRLTLTVLIALFISVFARSADAELVTYGGDAIGLDSSWTDGWGANTANGQDPGWTWHHNAGHPAFLYTSDGLSTIVGLRSIVAAAEHTEGMGVNWSKFDWTVDIFTLDSYLSMGQPITTVNLGAEPDNWSGFIEHDVRWVTPNTDPFGVPGGNAPAGTVSYELSFDLSGITALEDPLPLGDYIVGLQSRHGMSGFGTTAMLSSRVGIGPEPYYSATDRDVPIDPTKVIGPLTSNQDFRWAMNLTIDTPNITPHPVPEPSSLVLMTGAIVGGGVVRVLRRRRTASP